MARRREAHGHAPRAPPAAHDTRIRTRLSDQRPGPRRNIRAARRHQPASLCQRHLYVAVSYARTCLAICRGAACSNVPRAPRRRPPRICCPACPRDSPCPRACALALCPAPPALGRVYVPCQHAIARMPRAFMPAGAGPRGACAAPRADAPARPRVPLCPGRDYVTAGGLARVYLFTRRRARPSRAYRFS